MLSQMFRLTFKCILKNTKTTFPEVTDWAMFLFCIFSQARFLAATCHDWHLFQRCKQGLHYKLT